MNDLYKTLDLHAAWLVEVSPYNSCGGIKNIIGIKVKYNEKDLFYSILDNCFFQIIPKSNHTKNVLESFQVQLFVEIYEYQEPPYECKTTGMELYKEIKKEYITKKEIINSKNFLTGYFSDLDYDLSKLQIDVALEKFNAVEENMIVSVQEYEEKLGRYDRNHIYGPNKTKMLK